MNGKAIATIIRLHLGLLIVVCTWVIFFIPILSGQKVYFLDDLKILYYPLEDAYKTFFWDGSLPQWDTNFGFGHPLLAWGQLGFFTPLHVILRFLSIPPVVLLQISIVLHYLIGLIGMYILLRMRSFHDLAASSGAAVFVFSGFHIGHLNHINFFTSTMFLPWLLIAILLAIERSSLRRAAIVSLVGAFIIVSGQPQVVAYTFVIGAIFTAAFLTEYIARNKNPMHVLFLRSIPLLALAGILAIGVSSFSLLPLLEFLPQTERGEDLPPEQLYEFSYPPWHAITLVLPYFYGDHATYWGAKGFQELAAFVGLPALALAGVALAQWNTKRPERISGIILCTIALGMALGKYSPIYSFLVERHIWESFNIPGRFAFLFDTGISLLVAVGINDLLRYDSNDRAPFRVFALTLLVPAVLLAPFVWHIQQYNDEFARLMTIAHTWPIDWLVFVIGVITICCLIAALLTGMTRRFAPMIAIVISLSLIGYGWNYNPRVDSSTELTPLTFSKHFATFEREHGVPPRLLSYPMLIQGASDSVLHRTEPLSPSFTIHQPFQNGEDILRCLTLPLQKNAQSKSTIVIAIRESIEEKPIRAISMKSQDITSTSDQEICFPPISDSAGRGFILSLSSLEDSGIVALYRKSQDPQQFAYFVRVRKPTIQEFEQSQKPLTILLHIKGKTVDSELLTLARHLQAPAGASSARWIGALSIKPYREFIETFFANDREPFDGDGKHAIQRYRKILDLAGVTHLIQTLPEGATDGMELAGYTVIDEINAEDQKVRLYKNPQAYPKAFMVQNSKFIPASDETRYAMMQPDFNPSSIVYVSGPTPPTNVQGNDEPFRWNTSIIRYEPTRVDVMTEANADAFLVVTDSTTKQWTTYVDEIQQGPLTAYSIFKAAQVSSGSHIISFRYSSRAVEQAMFLTIAFSIAIAFLLISPSLRKKVIRRI